MRVLEGMHTIAKMNVWGHARLDDVGRFVGIVMGSLNAHGIEQY